MADKIPTFKLLLVGDGAVGKTSFVKRHRTGEFEKQYIPTVGLDVHPLMFHTSKGPICFRVWDIAGQEKYSSSIQEAFYLGGDCAIVMFDVLDKLTFKNVPNWCRDIVKVHKKIPVVICGNKVDRETDREVKASAAVKYAKKKGFEYFDISAKTNYNFLMPFLHLARVLLNDSSLVFIEVPSLLPPESVIDSATLKTIESNIASARDQDFDDAQDDDI